MSGYTTDWLKWIDSSGADFLTSSTYDSSNNYIYACGYSSNISSVVTISGINYNKPNGLSQAAYIVRYDTSGGGVLTHFIDGSGSETSNTIRIDNSGNIYYTGTTSGQGTTGITISGVTYLNPAGSSPSSMCYLVKIRPNYTVSWVQFFDPSGLNGITTAKNLYIDNSGFIYFIAQTQISTGVYINGTRYARVAGSGTSLGSYLIKYDTNGTMQWFQAIDGAGSEFIDGITADSSLNIYVAGYTAGSSSIIINLTTVNKPGSTTAITTYIAKYTTNGIYQWVRFIDTGATNALEMSYITYNTNTDSIFLQGSTPNSVSSINISGVVYPKPGSLARNATHIIKTNTNFNVSTVQWITNATRSYDITNNNNNIYVTGFCETIPSISGYTIPYFSLNSRAIYLCKFDASLQLIDINLIENRTANSSNSDTSAPDITFDNNSNIYVPNYIFSDVSNIFPDYLEFIKPYPTTGSSSLIKYRIANPPLAPLNISGYGGILSVNISWDSSADANGYRIFYGVSGTFNLSGFTRLVTSTTISSLLAGTYYNFYITALNGAGSSSNSSTIYVLTLPSTPTGLSGTSFIESVNLTWDSVSGITDYKIYYGLSGSLDLSAAFTGLSGNIGGLTPDVFYNFTVVAINSSGESSQSSPIYISPEFNTVSGIIVTSNLNSFDLSWNSIPGATNYDVYSGLSGYYSYIKNSAFTYTSISGIPNQWYNIAITTKGTISQSTSPLSYAAYSMAYSSGPNAISASNGIESSVIAWQSLYNVNNYKIYYGLSGTFDLSANFTFP